MLSEYLSFNCSKTLFILLTLQSYEVYTVCANKSLVFTEKSQVLLTVVKAVDTNQRESLT